MHNAVINRGLATEVMAIDCEMVTAYKNKNSKNDKGERGSWPCPGRCSIVNSRGQTVLDTFISVHPSIQIKCCNYSKSGIREEYLMPENGALTFKDVYATIVEILQNRTVVGHDIRNDLKVMRLTPKVLKDNNISVQDTQVLYGEFETRRKQDRTKSALKSLSKDVLNLDIQTGDSHDSTEDAIATMKLFLHYQANKAADQEAYLQRVAAEEAAKPAEKAAKLAVFKAEQDTINWTAFVDPTHNVDEEGFAVVRPTRERKYINRELNKAKLAKENEKDGDEALGWDAPVPWQRKRQ